MERGMTLQFIACLGSLMIVLSGNSCNQQVGQTIPVLSLVEAPGAGFESLFNGEDFTGWNIEPDSGSWYVEDAQIHCKGKPRVPYLIRTEKDYENFDFYAEFNVSENCNSGIFFHVPFAGRDSKIGFEVQIKDDAGKERVGNTSPTGSIYGVIYPRVNAMKPPGEWNQYRILFDWPTCSIWLNGQLIIEDADFSAHPDLKYRMRRGKIGLSNHGHVVHYRNLWIKELPDKEQWQSLFNGTDLSGWTTIGNANWHVDDGMIVATRGEGYLVSNDEFNDYQFQAYVANDTIRSEGSCLYYRWKNRENPGYKVELAQYADFKRRRALGQGIHNSWIRPWLLYQIISSGHRADIVVNGYVTSANTYLNSKPGAKIAIYHSRKTGTIKIQQVRIKEAEQKNPS